MADPASPPTKRPAWVLDTSAILSGHRSRHLEASIAPPAVAAEFSPGGRTWAQWQRLRAAGLKIHEPETAAIEEVEQQARSLGETGLSSADLEVAALTWQYREEGAVAVTDDYSLQNLLAHLRLPWQGARQPGITTIRRYHLRCSGCGRWFAPGRERQENETCPICGSVLRKKERQSKKDRL